MVGPGEFSEVPAGVGRTWEVPGEFDRPPEKSGVTGCNTMQREKSGCNKMQHRFRAFNIYASNSSSPRPLKCPFLCTRFNFPVKCLRLLLSAVYCVCLITKVSNPELGPTLFGLFCEALRSLALSRWVWQLSTKLIQINK